MCWCSTFPTGTSFIILNALAHCLLHRSSRDRERSSRDRSRERERDRRDGMNGRSDSRRADDRDMGELWRPNAIHPASHTHGHLLSLSPIGPFLITRMLHTVLSLTSLFSRLCLFFAFTFNWSWPQGVESLQKHPDLSNGWSGGLLLIGSGVCCNICSLMAVYIQYTPLLFSTINPVMILIRKRLKQQMCFCFLFRW